MISTQDDKKWTKQQASARLLVVAAVVLLGVLLVVNRRPLQIAWWTNLVALRILKETASQADVPHASGTAWLEAVMQSAPNTANLARLSGYYYLRHGRTADAARLLESATPHDGLTAFWLGEAYDSQGRRDEAISAYRQAGAAPYFLERGHGSYAVGDYESACSNYSRAVEIAPDVALAHMYMGHCHFRRGEFLQAEASYRRAIQLDPQYGYPYLHLANLLREQLQRPDLARDVLLDCIGRVKSAYWRRECLTESQRTLRTQP